ncbi:DUF111 family protein, partial [bacterium]|nr:DUF111 family protein [bacterium]
MPTFSIFLSSTRLSTGKYLTPIELVSLKTALIRESILSVSVRTVNFVASPPLNLGQGWVKSSHGRLPVPAPAVAELLKGIPVYSAWIKAELVTPTGAAIVSTLVKKFIPLPELSYEKIGCGAGTSNFRELPNILRAFYGNKKEFNAERKAYMIEANIDDSNPQILA